MSALRVLVADDDFHVARLHAAVVDATPGFAALAPVGTGDAVLRAAAASAPDLVLLDVFLPDISGLDVLPQLDVDCFIISAASDPVSVRRAMRRGALGYLIKPFAEAMLRQRLDAYHRYRRLLGDRGVLDQDAVDRAERVLHSGGRSTSQPQALTELAIMQALERHDGAGSAVDVAAAVGVSRATAQRYLSRLVDEGAVTVQLRYGATGRPEHRYELRRDARPRVRPRAGGQ